MHLNPAFFIVRLSNINVFTLTEPNDNHVLICLACGKQNRLILRSIFKPYANIYQDVHILQTLNQTDSNYP